MNHEDKKEELDDERINYIHKEDVTDELRKQIMTCLGDEFVDNKEEITASLNHQRSEFYDFRTTRIYVHYRDIEKQEVTAAAIVVIKNIRSRSIWECIWLVVKKNERGTGYGDRLFKRIHNDARRAAAYAMLVTSTNSALSFWLSRTNVDFIRYVYRGSNSLPSYEGSLRRLRKLIFDSESTDEHESEKSDLNRLFTFKVYPRDGLPVDAILDLYTDEIWRDRKGRITRSTVFDGRPYRYGISSANHVWFPLAKTFVRRLKQGKLRRNKSIKRKGRSRRQGAGQQCRKPADSSVPAVHEKSLIVRNPRRVRLCSREFFRTPAVPLQPLQL